MIIGYQGLVGCNSYNTIINNFCEPYTLKSYTKFLDLFNALHNNEIECFVIPIKNFITGMIEENFRLVTMFNHFKVVSTLETPINHTLYGLENSSLEDIKTIISHSQALKQCSQFVKNYETDNVWNTVGAIDIMIKKNDKSIGCIAPNNLVESKIKILKENISDMENNRTFFYVIGKNPNIVYSLIIHLPDEQ